ncbi:hypothetical protein ACIHCX_03210 [Streptomyces sp. NPDC052043]|uniref:hypothetical protein n=1 Tax=Streptomyces sp. NPDC052043 TaxID=3365684 RepID=UPI0037CF9A02
MTEQPTPPRDRLFALIASIPGSGTVNWCDEARALLDEIATPPAAVQPPADRAALRDRIAEALTGAYLTAPDDSAIMDHCADAVLAVLPEPVDRPAAGLSQTERDMLRYALDLAQEQMFSRGDEFGEDDQPALDRLRRLACEQPA